jgi:hypothetical protein
LPPESRQPVPFGQIGGVSPRAAPDGNEVASRQPPPCFSIPEFSRAAGIPRLAAAWLVAAIPTGVFAAAACATLGSVEAARPSSSTKRAYVSESTRNNVRPSRVPLLAGLLLMTASYTLRRALSSAGPSQRDRAKGNARRHGRACSLLPFIVYGDVTLAIDAGRYGMLLRSRVSHKCALHFAETISCGSPFWMRLVARAKKQ